MAAALRLVDGQRARLESRRRPMPRKQHLPSVSDKEQRMYEAIKASERKRGRPLKRAKAVAAATVVKHHNEKGHKPGK
jgi:hypothetical protein